MAKKYEFRPDKPRVSILSKLHLTKMQRAVLLKWALYSLLLLVLSLLQDVVFCRLRLFGATSELVPCAIFLICVLEGAEKGGTFALVSAALYVFSGTAAGPYCLILITFIAVFVCIFRQGYLQPGFAATMLCTVFSVVAYEMIVFAIGLVLGLTNPDRLIGFVITAFFSAIAAPVLYPIALFIGSIGGETWKE